MDKEKPADLKLSQELATSADDTEDHKNDQNLEVGPTPESADKQPPAASPQTLTGASGVVPMPHVTRRKETKNQSDKQSKKQSSNQNERKRFVIGLVGLLVAACLGMSINMLWPLMQNAYFPSPEMLAFHHASSNTDWPAAKIDFKNAIAYAGKGHASTQNQIEIMCGYGDALRMHNEYREARDVFEKCAALCAQDRLVDWQTYCQLLKGYCEHDICLQEPNYKPNIESIHEAMILTKTRLRNDLRVASFLALLGRLNADLGETKAANEYLNKADAAFSKLKGEEAYHREVFEDKWKMEMQSILADLEKKPKPPPSSLAFSADIDGSVTTQALVLLQERKFSELDKLFDKARTARVQSHSGHELIDQLYAKVSHLQDAPEGAWRDRLALLNAWQKAQPDSPTPHVVLADFYNNYAWTARGSAWGKDVSQAQWLEFDRRIFLGSEQLHQALNAGPITPEWFSITQVNMLGGGQKRNKPMYEKLISIGLTDFPNYMPIYLFKTYYLQPRWEGTGSEWVDFVTKKADQLGGEEGDRFYARMVANVSSLYDDVYKEFPTLSRARVSKGDALLDKQFGIKVSKKKKN